MSIDKKNNRPHPAETIRGLDLERWRAEVGLTKNEAADAFGWQRAKWDKLTIKDATLPITDSAVIMLLCLYREYPDSVPRQRTPDIREFYSFLGFQDAVKDREKFANLIGRTLPTVYPVLFGNGRPGRPVIRWIEAIKRLQFSPAKSLRLMEDLASRIEKKDE